MPTTVTVKKDGSGDATTIQAGLNLASTGDTVEIQDSGTYYEGEIKTMLRGGVKHLLDRNIEFSSNLRDSQKDLIADEVGDLRKEVSELKEMIKLLIQNK